jgi:hypothetical protein
MTRITRTLILIVATTTVGLGAASAASAADYSTGNAVVGDPGSVAAADGDSSAITSQPSGPMRSLDGIVASSDPPIYGSLDAIAATSGSSSLTSDSSPARSSAGFDWGDAAIGAAVSLGLALSTALMFGFARRRTPVGPSV